MIKHFIAFIILLQVAQVLNGQIIVNPEHGFLPGKKFEFYSTIDKYDLAGSKFRIEVYDDRDLLKLNKVECSNVEFTNTSEFANPSCIGLLAKYADTLFYKSNATVDSSSADTIQIRLEGIDARLIGFGKIRAHGLCQITAKYHNFSKRYCIDITDADKNSPVSSNAFVTRKTATRIIGSAAMREVIEAFLKDLSSVK
jgi:hypothetical protein